MSTYYGPYQALEKKFLAYASALQPGPQRPVLVLCPSGRMAEYLRRKLARRNGLISNVFFVTFSQLISTLDAENGNNQLALLPNDHFHDYLLKQTLQTNGLNRYPVSRGFLNALKSSLRDLADSLADPVVLQEHADTFTDPFLQEDAAHWQWLVQVYKAYQQKLDQVPGYRSYQQYFTQALQQASQGSRWLHSFQEILVYGFYELTGRQLELFQVLRSHYPVTVFWAYADTPSFAFGRKFFETNIAGSPSCMALPNKGEAESVGAVADYLFTPQAAPRKPDGLHLVFAPDPQGELFFVAKEMLRLHEQQDIAWEDMAVVARSLGPYQLTLPGLFAENAIAFQADFSTGLEAHPLGVFWLNLISLARNGFDREQLLAVINSPYFAGQNQWRYLVEESLAERDYNQWADLVRPGLKHYDPAFLQWLEQIKGQLEFLEKALSWTSLSQATLALLQQYTNTAIFTSQEQSLWQQVQEAVNSFARYETIACEAQRGEFVEELLAAWKAITVHEVYNPAGAVTVGEVQSLRGMEFKVIFLLGANEKIFPQVIREDPVLKDYYRRILRDQLGFWMNQKMERFEEERLLFSGVVQTARQQLYVSFLREDEAKKALVPSSYVVELARAAGVGLTEETLQKVPARLLDRLSTLESSLLTRQEISLMLAAQTADASVYEQVGLNRAQLTEQLEAAKQIATTGALTAYDGMIASGASIFQAQHAQGFSPSALQDLARCPLKYFFAKGVGLAHPDEVLSRSEIAPNLRGTIYHEVLMDYYQRLDQEGLTAELFDQARQERVKEAFEERYPAGSYKQFGIYPVIWDLLVQDMQEKLADFVVKDAQYLDGYVPHIFETYFEKIYQPSAQLSLKIKGIIDRIDVNPEQKTFRIVDYKSGRHGGKNLAADMFKQVILQPFLYLVLAQQQSSTQGLSADGAALLTIQKGYNRQELSQADFQAVQERAADFFTFLIQLVQQGQFFMHPGKHCAYCPYGAICRKDVFRSLLRASHSKQVRALEEATQ
ncbi:MAG: exodeoxyribonuclease V subunit gamma [Elusimicrobiaceae bacterium]|nr:exodeoxyribonuclease V subunit gamma [Elusimicrobiaceae bacterium]